MKVYRNVFIIMILITAFAVSAAAQETIYRDIIQKIREEAFQGSQIMDNASYLTDVFGPRLANSPSYKAAAEWAQKKLEEYGLSNARLDPYGEFGVVWRNDYTSVHMMTPQYMSIIAYPNTWSRGTDGKVRGWAVYINIAEITSKTDLEQYRGKLRNAIIFTQPKQEIIPNFSPMAVRYSNEQLNEMAQTDITTQMQRQRRRGPQTDRISRSEIIEFLFSEGVAAIAAPAGREHYGTVVVNEVPGRAWANTSTIHPPFLILAGEHYNRIVRILEKDIPVELEAEIRISITEEDVMDYNVLADLPGTDSTLGDEIVLIGGHLDANSAGTGATDNAAGAAIAMEAMRILKKIDAQPRRTIRVALWGGEEYGLLGSRGYISKYLGDSETEQYKPDHARFAAYFNRDGGTGRIRGIALQDNERARPIFEEWMKPFHDLGMTHIIPGSSWNSDHAPFDAVGLPGFNFVQDGIERRAYHTNMDVFDRLIPEDLVQSAIIMASFAYHAAMRDQKLPRITPSGKRRGR